MSHPSTGAAEPRPVRVQRSRQHKNVSPNGLPVKYVGRPSKWGNPFVPRAKQRKVMPIGFVVDDVDVAVARFRLHFLAHPLDLAEIRGKNLSCWCPLDQPCHADVLLELANA